MKKVEELGMGKKIIILLSALLMLTISAGAVGKNTQEPIDIQSENNSHFKDIVIKKLNGKYEVVGKAKVRKGVFYYTVEDGHNVLVSEKKLDIHNLHWTSFKIKLSIPKEKLPKNGTLILFLYEKDRAGKLVHQHHVILDTFKETAL